MKSLCAIALLLLIFSCNSEVVPVTIASAEITGYDLGLGSGTIGTFRATQVGDVTEISVVLKDQTPGSIHAIHLLQGNCETPGEIWNGGNEQNYCQEFSIGQKWSKPRLGDLGNISISSDGTGTIEFRTDLWTLIPNDQKSIVGLLVIVRDKPEDFLSECDPNHVPDHFHPNIAIGCGTIELIN